jgi:hypothetical protein
MANYYHLGLRCINHSRTGLTDARLSEVYKKTEIKPAENRSGS